MSDSSLPLTRQTSLLEHKPGDFSQQHCVRPTHMQYFGFIGRITPLSSTAAAASRSSSTKLPASEMFTTRCRCEQLPVFLQSRESALPVSTHATCHNMCIGRIDIFSSCCAAGQRVQLQRRQCEESRVESFRRFTHDSHRVSEGVDVS